MGETQAAYLRRIRMHLAANALCRSTHVDLRELARQVGYTDPDSFSRAFCAQYGMTPRRFRERHAPSQATNQTGAHTECPVTMRDTPERRLFGLSHKGAYHQIAEAYDRLGATLAARGLQYALGPMVAVFYDDISEVAEPDLNSFAALTAPKDMPLPDGLEERWLPAGPVAVLTHRGPYSDLPRGYNQLFRSWFPASDYRPRDDVSYEVYLNSPIDTLPADLVTEIHVPAALR